MDLLEGRLPSLDVQELASASYCKPPRRIAILFNEDDHFDFDRPANNFIAAVGAYASWVKGEGFDATRRCR